MVATLSPPEIARRWSMFARSLAGERTAPGKGTGFWFDPAYAAFLEGVRLRTPPDATIVTVMCDTGMKYLHKFGSHP
jgi:cysteine synthase